MIVALVVMACTSEPAASPPPSRFESVKAAPKQVSLDGWCDQYAKPGEEKAFVWPDLDTPAPASGKATWVNVWATWCGPCVAEMPRLVKWRDQLAKDGVEADLVLLSVDAKPVDLDRFYKQHTDFLPTLHLRDGKSLPGWLTSVGLDSNVAIPLHFFLDSQRKVRCERSGAIDENDFADVEAALKG